MANQEPFLVIFEACCGAPFREASEERRRRYINPVWVKSRILQPIENQIGIHRITPRNLGYRNTRHRRLLTNLALLFIRPKLLLSFTHKVPHGVHYRLWTFRHTLSNALGQPHRTDTFMPRKCGKLYARVAEGWVAEQNKWQKLNGAKRMPEIIQGIAFVDGIKQIQITA